METIENLRKAAADGKHGGILYPVMLIAALAVIVLSVVGVATITGYMPNALSKGEAVTTQSAAKGSEPVSVQAPASSAPVKRASRPEARTGAPVAAQRCEACGVIESIRPVESKSQASGLGAIGGALVGGILGNQVGRGSGRTAATVVGAGAGAYAGHEIEQNVNKRVSYQIRVRMDDGTIRTFYEPAQPAYNIGQKVRVGERGILAPTG